MTRESQEEAVAEAPPERKPKFTLVVILSILIGFLLALLIGGLVYHLQSGKALEARLAATKEELKHKSLMVSDLQEQIAGLSMQMYALRDFSIGKANGVAVGVVAAEKQVSQADNAPSAGTVPEKQTKEPVAPAVVKKAKPIGLDCQIVGKSPEEQIATLQRCTQAMDGKSRR